MINGHRTVWVGDFPPYLTDPTPLLLHRVGTYHVSLSTVLPTGPPPTPSSIHFDSFPMGTVVGPNGTGTEDLNRKSWRRTSQLSTWVPVLRIHINTRTTDHPESDSWVLDGRNAQELMRSGSGTFRPKLHWGNSLLFLTLSLSSSFMTCTTFALTSSQRTERRVTVLGRP